MTFTREILIRFQHCDPAGIVFYPRYFEMVNQLIEDWFSEALGSSFQDLHLAKGLGVPTVRIECDFVKASRIGEVVKFSLKVAEIGTKSFRLKIIAEHENEVRLKVTQTLVCVELGDKLKSTNLPTFLREGMLPYRADQ